ncbi:MAG TPA: T9SS type A sorting domain-containing protein, partial [Flavobacterium sp.]|nr:T9SS type A sorting domain-containing protein [Flavobacterium sp.]
LKRLLCLTSDKGIFLLILHTAWNSGAGIGPGKQFNESIDDVDFIRTLIVMVSEQYAIVPDKVFAFGFSMGGFMVHRLALELNDKITAFASVAGTIGESLLPILGTISVRPVSIAHFHGTADSVVAYTNNAYGSNVSMMLAFWKKNNKSKPEAEHHFLPDRINDGLTVDHYRYTSEFNNAIIELFKINGGFHRWLNDEDNSDISYTDEIWKFFKKTSTLANPSWEALQTELAVYPNPIDGDGFTIKLSGNVPSPPDTVFVVSVYDNLGRTILQKECVFLLGEASIITTVLKKGIYLIEIKNKENFKRSFARIVAN